MLETVGRERGGRIDNQGRSIRRVGKGTSSGCRDGWERGVRRPQGERVFWRTVIQRGRNGVGFTGIGGRDKASSSKFAAARRKRGWKQEDFRWRDGGEYLMTGEVEETIEARLPGRWQYRPYLMVSGVYPQVRDVGI
jgi:hypothetical protein